MRCSFIAILFLLITMSAQAQDVAKVWLLGAIPSEASEALRNDLAKKLNTGNDGSIICEAKYSMGHQEKLQELLKSATDEKVRCLVCLDEGTARAASATNIPVIVAGEFGKTAFPKAVRVISLQPPLAAYIEDMQKAGWQGGRLALVMDKDAKEAHEQCEEVGKLYTRAFPDSEIVNVEIDSQTCAQLMDFVFAYNFLKSRDVKAVYLSEAGNVSRIMPFILNVAKKQKVPVFGGGESAARAGACLALVPEQDKLLDALRDEVRILLSGDTVPEMRPFRDFVMYHTPEVLNACGMTVPEDSGWKSFDGE